MFSLLEADLGKRILGCGDGPASFNAELTKRGGNVISVDPLYAYDEAAIRGRIDDAFEEVMRQTRANKEEFIWSQIPCVERLGQIFAWQRCRIFSLSIRMANQRGDT